MHLYIQPFQNLEIGALALCMSELTVLISWLSFCAHVNTGGLLDISHRERRLCGRARLLSERLPIRQRRVPYKIECDPIYTQRIQTVEQ